MQSMSQPGSSLSVRGFLSSLCLRAKLGGTSVFDLSAGVALLFGWTKVSHTEVGPQARAREGAAQLG